MKTMTESPIATFSRMSVNGTKVPSSLSSKQTSLVKHRRAVSELGPRELR